MVENDLVTQWWIDRHDTLFDGPAPLRLSQQEVRHASVIIGPFVLAGFVYFGVSLTSALAGADLDAASVFLGVCAVFAAVSALAIDRHRIRVRTDAEARAVRLAIGPELIEQMLVLTRACTRAEKLFENSDEDTHLKDFVRSPYVYLQLEAPGEEAYRSVMPLLGSLTEADTDLIMESVSDRMRFRQEGFRNKSAPSYEVCDALRGRAAVAAVSTLRAAERCADEFDLEAGCVRAIDIIRDADLNTPDQFGTQHLHENLQAVLDDLFRKRMRRADGALRIPGEAVPL